MQVKAFSGGKMAAGRRRLVAYLRCSTIEQTVSGFGLDVQRAAIKAAAKALDVPRQDVGSGRVGLM